MRTDLHINPALDARALGEQFRRRGRLQIHEFLTSKSAESLLQAFNGHKRWYLAYNEGAANVESRLEEVQRLPPAHRQQFYNAIYQRAGTQFQFCFAQYYISETYLRGEDAGHPLHAAHRFLNGEAFLAFMREFTGEQAIREVDALASIYAPGHFLTDHDDRHEKRDRVAAYVLNLSRNWNRNWGGHLVFFDEHGNITDGFVPSFNALNIFSVPQSHAVQLVTPYARDVRRSITGWLHR